MGPGPGAGRAGERGGGRPGNDRDAVRYRSLDESAPPQTPNPDADRERNRAERLVGRLKPYRRAAARYDKLAEMYLGFVHLALTLIRMG